MSVAGFAQFNPRYIDQMALFKNKIKSDKAVIVSADTESLQLKALKKGLSTVNVGQKPFEMGQKGAQYLYQYLQNKENAESCTVNY